MAATVTDPVNDPVVVDPTSDPNKRKFEFDGDEQKFIQKLIDTSVGRVHDKYKTQMETLQAQLDALKPNDPVTDPVVDPVVDDTKKQAKALLDQEKLKTKHTETLLANAKRDAEEARAESLRTRKEVAMSKAASKHNFYEIETVLALTDKVVEWNEDLKQFVVKEGSNIKQNSSMEPMTLDEYYAGFAAQRPYLVNGDVKAGAGSTDSNTTGNAGLVKTKADLKTAKEKSEYIDKFGLERYEVLPLK